MEPSTEFTATPPAAPGPPLQGGRRTVPIVITALVVALLGMGLALLLHARGEVNKVALASTPKLVTTVTATATTYRATRRYVGTIEPWVSARVGPQFVSAYVDTVLVRPGAVVRRGQVIATLDCRNASAANKAIAEEARAVAASQAALQKESERVSSLVEGGFASPNEAQMKTAESQKQLAQYQALRAQNFGTALQVSDCILRAPFDGEVSERLVDPGAFVHPGDPMITVVDRNTLRVTADVPEEDSDDVVPGTAIHTTVLATGGQREARISRRSPSAEGSTRTVHFEADIDNRNRSIPSGTTVEITLEAGAPRSVTEIPLIAASVKQDSAGIYVVKSNVAHAMTVPVVGERGGTLLVNSSLSPGTEVVTQGRLALNDGDTVAAKEAPALDAGLDKSSTTDGPTEVAP
jgi:RND family efflux transporter MFP subunit